MDGLLSPRDGNFQKVLGTILVCIEVSEADKIVANVQFKISAVFSVQIMSQFVLLLRV